VVRANDDSVCGRTAHVIEARRDDGSAAGRFWIDRDTGLMLHRELLDPGGRVANVTGFYSLRVIRPGEGITGQRPGATPPGRLLATAELATMRDHGWTLPRGLPGRLSLREARRSGGVVHLSYSDGLSMVSVFVQPGRLDEGRFAQWQRKITAGRTVFQQDALHRWAVWENGGYVYTVLADAPKATSDAIVAALPHGGSGFWARLGRGFGRLNPIG
jgi:sigma-E factor negative regulatory protein RseB